VVGIMMVVWMAVAAVLLDRLLGEPRRLHPLVGFGRMAAFVERRLWRQTQRPGWRRAAGIVAVCVTVAPFVWAADRYATGPLAALVSVTLLYFALGLRSLVEHASAVQMALAAHDLLTARAAVGRIVSRDCASLDAADVARATVESVLENGNDAVFGALFWFFVAGAPGVVLYRLANTLDAMWGYRSERYREFGWAAARLDDLLNWIPARLVALSYALLGRTRLAVACWRRQAPHWYSPNAGPVMAAGAGALQVELGGAAVYHGQVKARPVLGAGRTPDPSDIGRALTLVQRSVLLWLSVAAVLAGGYVLA
jgi:adenosylcobinamide-phosphate synthase